VSTLSRVSPAPVLVLPAHARADKTIPVSFSHIVSAVDFTVASAVAVRTVLGLVRRTGARLTLVHALTNASHPMTFSASEGGRAARTMTGRADEVAKHLRRKVATDLGIRVDARVTTGDPHRVILNIAAEVKADLIVMGVPPRTRVDEVLSGSTLRSVLRRAKIPVLVLPVPAGAYDWLEGPEAIGAQAPRTAGRATRLVPRR
jgi:nucleotide-binding universal stress UspA family protein